MKRGWLVLVLSLLIGLLAGCGGGGASDKPNNQTNNVNQILAVNELPVTVERWAGNSTFPNQLYVSVQVCVPSSNECQTIDHVLVDTGSFGLRLFDTALNINLSATNLSNGQLFECGRFVSGYTWGAVKTADVVLGGLKTSVPIQVVQQAGRAPRSCTLGLPRLSTPADTGANGILGLGVFIQDCGSYCETFADNGTYFSCVGVNCLGTSLAKSAQVANPAAMLNTDNNGVIIDLSDVKVASQQAQGRLILGVATRSNNALSTTQVLSLDSRGYFTTTYKGKQISSSYIDSGTNGYFFQDASLPLCVSSSFYCPGSPLALTAILSDGSMSILQNFTLDDPPGNANAVLPNLGGSASGLTFAWGLPFYYGKRVFAAFEQRAVARYNGPFVAF